MFHCQDPLLLLKAEDGVAESPGSRLPLNLASMTRAPTLQHISERINLISAQHNLGAPSKDVASLLLLAFEVCEPPSATMLSYLCVWTGKTQAANYSGISLDVHFARYHLHSSYRATFAQLCAPSILLRQLIHSFPRCAAQQVCGGYATRHR